MALNQRLVPRVNDTIPTISIQRTTSTSSLLGNRFRRYGDSGRNRKKFYTREQGLERLTKLVDWLAKADRFHGVWPHWLNGETGKVKPFSPDDDGGDLVETSYLMQGLLCVREYFKDGNEKEKALASKIDKLWKAVEFDWHRHGKNVLYWHWSPKNHWKMNFPVEGYNECLILYVLAAASPTHTIPPKCIMKVGHEKAEYETTPRMSNTDIT
jgi:hypothetical protein